MNYYNYQQTGMPPMAPSMSPYPQQVYPQGQMQPPGGMYPYPAAGYGAPYQPGYGGVPPNAYCAKCGGSGYRVNKKGKTKPCKCIKKQEKRMGKYYGYNSSDSD